MDQTMDEYGEKHADKRSGEIDPEMLGMAADQGGAEGTCGVHRGAANQTGKHGVESDRNTNAD